jgi:ferritin
VTEQVEEEKQTDEIVHVLKMVGDSAQILMLDAHLGKRE